MKKGTKYVVLGLVLVLMGTAGYVWSMDKPLDLSLGVPKAELPTTPDLAVIGDFVTADYVNIPMAFTSQAPFGEWSDPRQQDACEEASVAMIRWWQDGRLQISGDEAKADILALSALSEEMFGTFYDTSAADTAKLLARWVPEVKYQVVDLNVEVIEKALHQGKLVIVATDGRLLNNPNFSGGGPERHMFLIKGYDRAKRQFIANDVGTRQGADYLYGYDVVMNALIDYSTGNHEPLTSSRKVGLVITK